MLWTGAVIFWAVFTWSAVAPHDRFTWWLEVIPALIALSRWHDRQIDRLTS